MEQSPSWETNRFSASQEIPHVLWNPKVLYITAFTSTRHLSVSWAAFTWAQKFRTEKKSRPSRLPTMKFVYSHISQYHDIPTAQNKMFLSLNASNANDIFCSGKQNHPLESCTMLLKYLNPDSKNGENDQCQLKFIHNNSKCRNHDNNKTAHKEIMHTRRPHFCTYTILAYDVT
jgi:hypothetical protein